MCAIPKVVFASFACAFIAMSGSSAFAQEPPYFVTYSHYLEERGNLEVAVVSTTGLPKAGRPSYTAPWLELAYGVTGWWTTELYLEGVTTRHNGSGFTGWRWENRFRPLKSEHRVNPVLYVEYESINEATRIQKEIVGSGTGSFEPIAELRKNVAHELEGKLILSSVVNGWNVAENFIVEKNLSAAEGLEFGYSVGVARSLGGLASGTACHLCRENFTIGVEAYGGLGTTKKSGLADAALHCARARLARHRTDHPDALVWFRRVKGQRSIPAPGWMVLRIVGAEGSMMLKAATFAALVVLMPVFVHGDQVRDRNDAWVAATQQASKPNPLASRTEAVAGGVKVFHQRCAACHGEDGRGTTKAPDLTAPHVQGQPDGALFWKISSGNTHAGMPSFSFLPEPQRWQLVLRLRALMTTHPLNSSK